MFRYKSLAEQLNDSDSVPGTSWEKDSDQGPLSAKHEILNLGKPLVFTVRLVADNPVVGIRLGNGLIRGIQIRPDVGRTPPEQSLTAALEHLKTEYIDGKIHFSW